MPGRSTIFLCARNAWVSRMSESTSIEVGKQVVCPLCHSSSTRYFFEHNVVDQKVYACCSCGFYFVWPHRSYIPSDEHKDQNKPFTFWGSPEAQRCYDRWRQQENDRMVRWMLQQGELGKVLEIGFGEGPLTEALLPHVREYWGASRKHPASIGRRNGSPYQSYRFSSSRPRTL